jgi:hypothetical protein
MKKGIIILSIIFGILLLALLGSVIFINVNKTNSEEVLDINALYIGTSKLSTTNTGETNYNIMHIKIYDNSNIVEDIDINTHSNLLINGSVLDENLGSFVFLDLSEIMKGITGDLGIKDWHLMDPTRNFIIYYVEFTMYPIMSEISYDVDDSGVYLFYTPVNNGDVIAYSHSYIYRKQKFGF